MNTVNNSGLKHYGCAPFAITEPFYAPYPAIPATVAAATTAYNTNQ
jgi:hypothetical protein